MRLHLPHAKRAAALLLLGTALAAAAQQNGKSAPAQAERLAEAQRREAESDRAERAAALAPLPAPVFTPPPATQPAVVSPAPPASLPASAPAPAAVAAPRAQPPPLTEEQIYNTALTQIQLRSLPAARQTLAEFSRLFPNSRRRPNAAFWQAEIDFLEEHWSLAREGFLGVTKNFPDHPKAADSLYKAALCSLKRSDKQSAIGLLSDVLRRFPASEAALLAEKKLAELTKRT